MKTLRHVLHASALLLVAAGAMNASTLSGDTISATLTAGNTTLWGISSVPAQPLPAGYTLGLSGFPVLNVSIDADGLITLNPSGQSCSSGCGWNLGDATLQFVLDAGAPQITSITTETFSASLGATFALGDGHTFDINFTTPAGGTTNADLTIGQLEFAQTPEPATFFLGGAALAGFAAWKRRRLA